MFDNDKMLGYCPLCMQNVEHTRKFSSWIMLVLDLLTLRIFRIFRIGPFYCYQCETKTLYLKPVRRDAPTFDVATSTASYRDGRHVWVSSQSDEPTDQNESGTPFEPVGNFLKAEQSLLMQERRSQAYSQKFRDAAVARILAGNASLLDIRNELQVKETDLIRWIGDLMNRKQQQIDELKATLLKLQTNLPEHLQPLVEAVSQIPTSGEGSVIEGEVADR
jgi:transposase-like protein